MAIAWHEKYIWLYFYCVGTYVLVWVSIDRIVTLMGTKIITIVRAHAAIWVPQKKERRTQYWGVGDEELIWKRRHHQIQSRWWWLLLHQMWQPPLNVTKVTGGSSKSSILISSKKNHCRRWSFLPRLYENDGHWSEKWLVQTRPKVISKWWCYRCP